MDLVMVISFIATLAMLFSAFVMEGGALSALLQPTAAMIVIGGTFGVVGMSFPSETLRKIPKYLSIAFRGKKENREELLSYILELATIARKDGLLALESEVAQNKFQDDFIVSGLQLVIDGVDTESINRTLENKITNMEERHAKGIEVFASAGGYAPTLGVLGTVMGLVQVLSDLSNPQALGGKIAVAFIATLYGVGSANVIWLPISTKLKEINADEVVTKYMLLEGITMIQTGSNPALIREQLKGYLGDEKVQSE